MARYVMTARRKAALRKAQLASARKRRGRRLSRKQKAGVLAAIGGLAVARHMVTGSRFYFNHRRAFHGENLRHNPLKAYLGHDSRGPILLGQKDWNVFERIRDDYGPGKMNGFVVRTRRRRFTAQYTHVKFRDNRKLARNDKRAEKAYFKKTRRVNKQFRKVVYGGMQ